MKRPSKKEELCRQIILLDNYETRLENGYDEDCDLDLMVANGEFAKMVAKNTAVQLEYRLHGRIERFFDSWYKELIPEIQSIADRFDANNTKHIEVLSELSKSRDNDVSAILNTMNIWPNPTMEARCDKCTIKIYPSKENYHHIEVSFYKWTQDPAMDDWQFTIRLNETTLTINPDGQQEKYAIYGCECMDLVTYLYRHTDYLKQIVKRIVKYRDDRDNAIAEYEAVKERCYAEALEILMPKAIEMYQTNKN